ncbi:hypothetical protein QP150_18965 [Sphingomonas sp. 22L2VL55-3]
MEAKLVNELPVEPGWQYEPKWDGFRALVFRDGEAVDILSKSGKPLGRYFPEIVALVASVPQERFVLDGEIILPIADILSFDALQARLHPAQSRIDRLAKETPAQLMLFDCLGVDDADLINAPLSARRKALEPLAMSSGSPKFSTAGAVTGQGVAPSAITDAATSRHPICHPIMYHRIDQIILARLACRVASPLPDAAEPSRLHQRLSCRLDIGRDLKCCGSGCRKGTLFATRHKRLSASNVARAAPSEMFETQYFRAIGLS